MSLRQNPEHISSTRAAALVAIVLLTPVIAMAIEEPKFRVVETSGNFQIREYQPVLVAEVEATGERSSAAISGFRMLADFIFGNNHVQQKINMTAPVTQVPQRSNAKVAMTAPVTQAPVGSEWNDNGLTEQRWRVTFTMPSHFNAETLPLPNDPLINIREIPGRRVATVTFGGFSTQANLRKHRDLLERFVKDKGLEALGPYEVAFYDDPFTLPWNRRNEWWVQVAP
ncbi:MAG: heme-binding protein [Alphaproteobacteria bacterium]|nr:heme-binding protein [Alphaproteobacteria bacterium]